MQTRGLKILGVLISAVTLIILSACGEERNHKPLPKIEVYSKASIDTEAEYLYVPSSGQVTRTTTQSRPYWQGEERIVKLKFEKNHLVAYAQEKDDRFDDNITNNKPVFRIPITHVDYREARDPFGEGTNIEEENNYIEWSKRRYFEPKPEKFQFTDVNLLPSEYGKIFGYECSTETGQSELEFDVDKTGVDIVVKRDYRSQYFCSGGIDNEWLDLSWSEVVHYSLVKMDSIVSKDYKTIEYDRDWERTFGFFETFEQIKDSANNSTQDGEVYYLNRWNPQRKDVVYHLDPRFEKPENQSIKAATLLGFERLNAALDKADLGFNIIVKEGPEGMRPGDLRYTSVVLVEDPIKSGVLGYGPSVANPRTGEIVQARTVMYPGVMKQFIRRAYDDLLRKEAQKAMLNANASNLISNNKSIVDGLRQNGNLSVMVRSGNQWEEHQGDLDHLAVSDEEQPGGEAASEAPSEEEASPENTLNRDVVRNIEDHLHDIVPSDAVDSISLSEEFIKHGDDLLFDRSKFSLDTVFHGFKDQNVENNFNIDAMKIEEFYSKNSMYPARLETFVKITDSELRDQVLQIGQGLEWDELDDTARKELVDLILPYVWVPTFIHEVGHNLGLRHNFAGSEDEANFYTPDELESLGVKTGVNAPYASMMEYPKSDLNSLRAPGKYDVAALRYGYKQEAALEDGSIVSVTDKKPGELTLAKYEYCSDEGVSLNPNCNRFDEGVGYKAIAESIIDSYREMYELRNFRQGRANFSMMDDISYAARINSQFRSLRLMYERFADILIDFNIDMSTVETVDWLKDMNEGSKIAAEFFMDVIAEPDLSCVLTQNGQFAAIIPYAEIKSLTGSFEAKSCADIQSGLSAGYEVVGQFGRQYESEKYRDNPNIYLDQIDVRGVWIDKLFALKYLVARNLNEYSFDENTLSYLDHPEIGSEVNVFVKNLLMGDVVSENTVVFNDGSTLEDFEYGHSFANGYSIKKQLTPYINWHLNVKNDKVDFVQATTSVIQKQIYQGETSINNESFQESIRAYRSIPEDGRAASEFEIYRLGPENYVVSQDNELGLHMLTRLKQIDLYDQFERQDLIDIYTLLAQGQPLPSGATAEEKEVAANGLPPLLMYLRGEMPQRDYYYKALSYLASDNRSLK